MHPFNHKKIEYDKCNIITAMSETWESITSKPAKTAEKVYIDNMIEIMCYGPKVFAVHVNTKGNFDEMRHTDIRNAVICERGHLLPKKYIFQYHKTSEGVFASFHIPPTTVTTAEYIANQHHGAKYPLGYIGDDFLVETNYEY